MREEESPGEYRRSAPELRRGSQGHWDDGYNHEAVWQKPRSDEGKGEVRRRDDRGSFNLGKCGGKRQWR